MKWLLCLALAISVIATALADSSGSGAGDSRLGKRVALEVNHARLEEVADSLSKQTEVTIKAGIGERDWRVRERRVTIHARDITLRMMLEEIGKLTGYHLSREGKEGEWSYVIWQDKKARDLEAEMLVASKEAQARRASDVRQSTLDAAEDALKMTPEEALKRRDKEPLAAYLGGTRVGRGFAQVLSALQRSFPTEYELMMRGKKVAIPVAGFPPDLQGAFVDILSGRLPTWMDKDAKAGLVPQELVIEAMKGPDAGLEAALGLGGLAFLYARQGDQPAGDLFRAGYTPMSSLDSAIGNVYAKYLLALEEGASLDEAKKIADEAETPECLAELAARESPTEKTPPTDPALLREIEIREVTGAMQSPNLMEEQGKMMAEVARAAGIAVLLESYPSMVPVSGYIKKGKQPFYRILIAAEKAGCAWDLGEGTLRIRPEDWAIYRSQEVPESFLDHYKALIETNGWLTLDDIAAIAAGLTDAQIEGGLARDPVLSPILSAVTADKGRRDVLRAYGLMNTSQKSLVASVGGFPLSQLNDQQWDWLQGIITERLGGVQIVDGSIRLVPRNKEGERPSTEIIELIVRATDEKPRSLKTWVNVPTKADVKRMREERRKS